MRFLSGHPSRKIGEEELCTVAEVVNCVWWCGYGREQRGEGGRLEDRLESEWRGMPALQTVGTGGRRIAPHPTGVTHATYAEAGLAAVRHAPQYPHKVRDRQRKTNV